MKSKFEGYIHCYDDPYTGPWWIVAEYRDGCYYAYTTRKSYRASGCSMVYGSLDYLLGCAPCYRTRASALRTARRVYGDGSS